MKCYQDEEEGTNSLNHHASGSIPESIASILKERAKDFAIMKSPLVAIRVGEEGVDPVVYAIQHSK